MTAPPNKEEVIFESGGSASRPPGFSAILPSQLMEDRRGGILPPRPGLAPESALRLHPCRALSSAPVSTSVGGTRHQTKLVIVVVGKNNCR